MMVLLWVILVVWLRVAALWLTVLLPLDEQAGMAFRFRSVDNHNTAEEEEDGDEEATGSKNRRPTNKHSGPAPPPPPPPCKL